MTADNRLIRIIKTVGRGIYDFVLHFIRRCVTILFGFLIGVICYLIYIVTWEPGKRKRATKRKVRRIRALTKFKLYAYKYLWFFFDWIKEDYMKKLYEKYGFLINKKKEDRNGL